MSEFGSRLREIRTNMGLDQAGFGALGGVNRNTQSKYESGERAPDADYLSLVRDAGADIVYLLTGTRSISDLSTAESELIANLRTLPQQPRDNICALVASIVPSK